MSRVRFAGVDPSTIPTPPAGRSTLFVDINDLAYKAKLPDGSLIPISTTPEYIQDQVAAFFQDSSTIDIIYDDAGNTISVEVIESGLDIFQIPVTPTGNLSSNNVGDALNELQSSIDASDVALAAHLADPVDAHDASAISYDNSTSGLAADEVQAALDEIDQNLDDHLDGGANKHDATEIDYERADGSKIDIQAGSDNVESALTDLDDNKLSRSGVQAMTGDLNMDGNNIITGAGTVDGRDVSADGAKLDTIETNAKDDQIASEVPFTPAGVLTATDVQAALAELDEIISDAQIIVVSKSPGTGQFSSVKAAIDSISDASATKPYIVQVNPGIYAEDPIIMKNYVVLRGQDDRTSIITANDSTEPLITGASNSEINSVQLRGPTDSDVALIYYTGDTTTASGFSVIDCAFSNADRIYTIENNDSFNTGFRAEGNRVTSANNISSILYVDGSNSEPLNVFMDSFSYRDIDGPFPTHLFDIKGAQANVTLNNVLVELASTTTHGMHLEDGCSVNLVDCAFSGMSVGIHSHNVGAGQNIQSSGLVLRNCITADVLIQHPDTTGNINGIGSTDNLIIDDSSPITINISDLTGGGYLLSGPLVMGSRYSTRNQVLDLLQATPGMGIVFGGFLSDGGGFQVDVEAGFGYLTSNDFPDHQIKRIEWSNTSITLSANVDVYVYYNSSGLLTSSASIGNTDDIILIGRVVTNGSGIELIDQSPVLARNAINFLNRALRDGFGAIYSSGSIVTENSTPFKLDITAGQYFYSFNRYTPTGGTAQTFTQYYKDGLGGFNRSSTDTVNSTQYDDGSGTLQSLTAGYYTAHTLYINCDDADEKYFLVLGQSEYSALAAIESSPLPSPPSWLKDAVTPIARIVVQEGAANIDSILDIRPILGFKSSGVSASADHGNLLGLTNDDHPQYLLVNGSRTMANDLDMGGNDINNVATVDGVDVSAHAARHLPNGADPLATGIASTISDSTNSIGTANALARQDHVHAHGNRGGGTLHAAVTASVNGFMIAADKAKLDTIEANAKDDQSAAEVPYSNATSGMSATNVQAALDENDARLDAIEGETYVNSFNTRTGDVVPLASDYDADQIDYDNATSGLTATNVQDALDENDARLDAIEAETYVNSFNSRTGDVVPQASDYDADQVDYDNATSGMSATNVQDALDENDARLDAIEAETYVNSFNSRTGDVVPAASDYDADQVDYDNSGSGLSATNVQDAIDENDSRLDAIEAQTYVNSFNSRTGTVIPQSGDYNGSQITNTPAGDISSTNVQAAINELDAEKQPIDSDLTAIAGLGTTGIIVRTGTGTAATRTIQAAAGEVTVSNGDGVAANPTIGLPDVGTASTVGGASQSLSITTDAKGRITSKAAQAIAILSTQVTDFATAVRSVVLTGFSVGSNVAIAATDTILQAFSKVQGQINERVQGPATSTDNAITRYDGATGKLVQNSSAFVDDNGGIIAGNFVRVADTSNTTNGNIRYNSNEMQGRVNGTWRELAIIPQVTSQTANTSTTSGTLAVIAGMASTPGAGTYNVIFECSAHLGDDTSATIALFVNGVEQTAYTKTLEIQANGGLGPTGEYEVPVTIYAANITVAGGQTIDVRFAENGGGTLTIGPRVLTLIPIAR